MWAVMRYLSGRSRQPQVRRERGREPTVATGLLLEAITQGEARVLRYLPTHLSAREIAEELYVSMNTVKTHQRHLYAKLDAHSRAQAVERARALGLLMSP
jgi:LuxR family transcriptional regulator, maltose regulon positive regulatory protein